VDFDRKTREISCAYFNAAKSGACAELPMVALASKSRISPS
jgi:hypothetical protein